MVSKRVEEIFNTVYQKVENLISPERFYAVLYDSLSDKIESPIFIKGSKLEEWPHGNDEKNILLPDFPINKSASLLHGDALRDRLANAKFINWPNNIPPQSCLHVPIITEERVLGVLTAESWEKTFSKDDIRLFETIARQTAIAVEKSRIDESLDQMNANLMALNEMGLRLASAIRLSEREILELIYELATKLMDTDNMYIALYDSDPNQKNIYNPEKPENNKIYGTIRFGLMIVDGQRVNLEQRKVEPGNYGRMEEIILYHKPIFIETRDESEEWYRQLGRTEYFGPPLASWIGVPMLIREKVLGVIAAYHKTKDYVYNKNNLLVLTTMANQAAVAIDNARLYSSIEDINIFLEEKVLERTKELEREKERAAAAEALAALGTVSAGLQHRINSTLSILMPNLLRIKMRLDPDDHNANQAMGIIERNVEYLHDHQANIKAVPKRRTRILRFENHSG